MSQIPRARLGAADNLSCLGPSVPCPRVRKHNVVGARPGTASVSPRLVLPTSGPQRTLGMHLSTTSQRTRTHTHRILPLTCAMPHTDVCPPSGLCPPCVSIPPLLTDHLLLWCTMSCFDCRLIVNSHVVITGAVLAVAPHTRCKAGRTCASSRLCTASPVPFSCCARRPSTTMR